MENVILIVHLILALCLIGVVLLQRSEGGGLGMGSSGGGGGGVMTGRQAASALSKLTWIFAAAFIGTSILMTVIAAKNSAGGSVVDRLGTQPAAQEETVPSLPNGDSLLPPTTGDAPLAPPRAD